MASGHPAVSRGGLPPFIGLIVVPLRLSVGPLFIIDIPSDDMVTRYFHFLRPEGFLALRQIVRLEFDHRFLEVVLGFVGHLNELPV